MSISITDLMTQFYSANISCFPQSSSLASTGYESVLYEGQNPFKGDQYELYCWAGFQDTKNLVTTQLFFVNFFGNPVFRIAPLVYQFKRQVDQYNIFVSSKGIIETDMEFLFLK